MNWQKAMGSALIWMGIFVILMGVFSLVGCGGDDGRDPPIPVSCNDGVPCQE